MSKDIVWYAENVCGVDLTQSQKEILKAIQESKDRGQKLFLHYGRTSGIGLLRNVFNSFEIWIKDQRIAELEEQLKNAIVPKFKIGQEVFIICENVVKNTTIDSLTVFSGNELSYYCKYVDGERMYLELDKNELFATKEEAQAKLKELQGE